MRGTPVTERHHESLLSTPFRCTPEMTLSLQYLHMVPTYGMCCMSEYLIKRDIGLIEIIEYHGIHLMCGILKEKGKYTFMKLAT